MFQDIRTMYPDTEDDKTQDQSLPSGISWSSSSTTNNANINPDIEIISADAETVKNTPTNVDNQENTDNQNQTLFQRLSPRILLTLHSPTLPNRSPSPSPSTISRSSYYIPSEMKVSYQGPSLGDDPNTRILQLKSCTPRTIPMSSLSRLRGLHPPPTPSHQSKPGQEGHSLILSVGRDTLNISITPPVLPLCFANALLTLYAVHEPGVDCKLPLLGK